MEKRNLINKKYYENSKEHCSACKIEISKAGKAYHLTSKKHIDNMKKISGEFNAISILEQTIAKLKATPTNTTDICIELINTLSNSLNYKPQEPKKIVEEVVEKEVLVKPKKIIIKKKKDVVEEPKKIVIKKKKEEEEDEEDEDEYHSIANITNALTLNITLSDEVEEFLEKKWNTGLSILERQERTSIEKPEIPRDLSVMFRYKYMRTWIDDKYIMDDDIVSRNDYEDLTEIINDDILYDLSDTDLEEKHKKVIRFCYWRIVNGEKFKAFEKEYPEDFKKFQQKELEQLE